MQVAPIFSKKTRTVHRNRATKLLASHDFLIKEASSRIIERAASELSHKSSLTLEIGSRSPYLSELEPLISTDISVKMLQHLGYKNSVCIDEEFLPFRNESFDTVISVLNLHWINDLPGTLIQTKNILKKDGLFIASILGGKTLNELRQVLAETDIELRGGLAPRVSPLIDIKDAGMLLQRVGLKLPVVDAETITVKYSNVKSLIRDLRGMGETNALITKPDIATTKTDMKKIEEKYFSLFADHENLIPATFEIVTMAGWKN